MSDKPLMMWDAKTDRVIGYRELLLGCGNSRDKRIKHGDVPHTWQDLTTLDIDPACKPDVVFDLSLIRSQYDGTVAPSLPFPDSHFAEIHAYEVLEHIGAQGDFHAFFGQFYEFWRVLKHGGLMVITVPKHTSPWAWGDPGHTRILPLESFYFLSQKIYQDEVGKTSITDYRGVWKGNFEILTYTDGYEHSLGVILKAIKE